MKNGELDTSIQLEKCFPKLHIMTQYSRKKVESGHSQQFSSRKPKDIQEIAETYFMLFIQ